MRRPVVRLPAAPSLLALSLVAGCSLQGLDRFDWPSCDQCEVLNERDGLGPDRCVRWRCDPQRQQCVLGPRDDDGDGHAPTSCGGDDCDDSAPSVYAGAPELCNGLDDDCNGWIDDAATSAAEPDAVLPVSPAPAWVSTQPVDGGLVAAYGAGGRAGVEVVSDPGADISPGAPLVLASSSPSYGLASDAIDDGCVSAVHTPIDVPTYRPCDPAAPDCPDGQECFEVDGGEGRCGVRTPGTTAASECQSDAQCDDGRVCNGFERCTSAGRCQAPTPSSPCSGNETCIESLRVCELLSSMPVACDIGEAAIADTGTGEYLAAAVTTQGCAPGALRVGYFVESPRTPASRYPVRRILQRGDKFGQRTTAWLGVDLGGDSDCPGPATGRPAGAPRGVAGPAIAALPSAPGLGRLRPQGLVAWLAGPVCRSLGNCPAAAGRPAGADDPLDVELIGVWLEEGNAAATPVGWVSATGDSEPVRLGVRTTATATRPAVSAWTSGDHAGYFVAYPKESGGFAVHVVLAMPDPSPECARRRSCVNDDQCAADETCNGTYCMIAVPECRNEGDCGPNAACDDGRCRLRPCISHIDPRITQVGSERRTTPDLDVPAALPRFASEQIVGDVVMAVGRTLESGAVEVAFAWLVEDGVAFALASYDPMAGTFTERPVQRFRAVEARELTIAHLDEGFVRAGATLDDEAVEDGARGGFVVMWKDTPAGGGPEEVRAVRFADYDGRVVAPGVVAIGTGRLPRVWTDARGAPRVLVHQDDAFAVIPGVCGPRAQ